MIEALGTLAYRLERPHSPHIDEAAAKHLREAAAHIATLEAALRSIAANTCCDSCQEAALVARAALTPAPAPEGLVPAPPFDPTQDPFHNRRDLGPAAPAPIPEGE